LVYFSLLLSHPGHFVESPSILNSISNEVSQQLQKFRSLGSLFFTKKKAPPKPDAFAAVPIPLHLHILQFLNRRHLRTVRMLNRHFHSLAQRVLFSKLPDVKIFVKTMDTILLFSRKAGTISLNEELKFPSVVSFCQTESTLYVSPPQEHGSIIQEYSIFPSLAKKRRYELLFHLKKKKSILN
jgi:hypothetical protein